MRVIIEGPDCCGKTTLAKRLAKDLRYAYHHEGPPPEGISSRDYYIGLLNSHPHDTIWDRFAYGQVVYGPLLRGQLPDEAEADWDYVNKHLCTSTLQILCLPPFEVAKEQFNPAMEALTYKQFEASFLMWEAARNMFVFDYTKPWAYETLLSYVKAFKA